MTSSPTRSLGDLCGVVGQRAMVGTTPYLEIGDVDPRTKDYAFSDKPAVKGALLAQAGDVIVSRVRPSRGAITLLHENQLALSSAFTILRPRHEMAGAFLFYMLAWNDEFLAYLGRRSKGALYPTVPVRDVLGFEIPVPPLPEQERAVRILDEAEALRRLRTKADGRAKRIVAALFDELFGDIETNPRAWPIVELGTVIGPIDFGMSVALSEGCEYAPGRLPVLRIANVTGEGFLNLSDLRYREISSRKEAQLLLHSGDLLFNWRNSPNWVGKTAIFDHDLRAVFASFLFRFRALSGRSDNVFLWFYLNQLRRNGFFEAKCRQAVSQANFGRDELAKIRIMLPPLTRQEEFAARVAEIHALEAVQTASRQRLDDLFQSLLRRAFQGEL